MTIFHKPLAVFTDQDVFSGRKGRKDPAFSDRLTGKAIVFDDENNVALVGTNVNKLLLLPGGGIEADESVEDGVIRECLEEIGCHVKLGASLGIVEDYRERDKKHKISHCYIANVVGEKGSPKLTESEKENGLHVTWISLSEAIKTLKKQKQQLRNGEIEFYNTGFNILQDELFLEKAQAVTQL